MAADDTIKDQSTAITKFISEASHKIKGPLTTIQLYSEAMAAGNVGSLTSEQLDYIKEINDASHRLIVMLKELEEQARKNV